MSTIRFHHKSFTIAFFFLKQNSLSNNQISVLTYLYIMFTVEQTNTMNEGFEKKKLRIFRRNNGKTIINKHSKK